MRAAPALVAAGIATMLLGAGLVVADAQQRLDSVDRGIETIRATGAASEWETTDAAVLQVVMGSMTRDQTDPTVRLEWFDPTFFDDMGNVIEPGDDAYLPEWADAPKELSVNWDISRIGIGVVSSSMWPWSPRPVAILAVSGGVLALGGLLAGAAGWQARRVDAQGDDGGARQHG